MSVPTQGRENARAGEAARPAPGRHPGPALTPATDLHQQIVECADRGLAFAVAVLLRAQGSTPCKTGAKAIIDGGGCLLGGTIGGGALEAHTQRRAAEAIQQGRPVVFDFPLQGDTVADSEPICGGNLRVLIDPTAAAARPAYAAAAGARRSRQPGVLLTTVILKAEPEVSVRFLDEAAARAADGFPGARNLGAVLEREEPELCAAPCPPAPAPVEVLVEPVLPKPRLLIVGGGHVGQAVALQASWVGFEIHVVDDRAEFTRPDLFPGGTLLHPGAAAEQLAGFPFARDTYVMLATHGHRHDAAALRACLRQPAAFVGMIGSRRKVSRMRDHFLQSGWATAEELDRIYAPIGLDVGALTVPEIATSIVAQLIAVRRRRRSPGIPLAARP